MTQILRPRMNSIFNRLVNKFWTSEMAVMMSSALVVGVLAGLGTVLFRKAVDFATGLVFEGATNPNNPSHWYLLVLPALGGLLVGLWMHVIKPQGPGQGVAGIMEAAALHGGRIDLRGSVGRVVGAVITLGSGGSAGPEDPSVQVGATVGSFVGKFLRLAERRMKTLVGCGAAAGIAAAFNAPISGVFFAVEIILGEFSGIAVSFVVIAAVAGAAVSQSFLGSKPAFTVPVYELRNPVELIFYVALGGLAALVGVAYIRVLNRTEVLFENWHIPDWLKPMLGGLAIGALAFAWRPDFLGIGYNVLQTALLNPAHDALFFFALVALKLIATSLTIGSGGQGGLFAPSLFLGGMLGIGFGIVLGALVPGLAAPPAAYGMVAMGAVLASAVRAPIVAILLPFEMTNDYHIILPLMLAVVTAFVVARRLERESVYTIKLQARGIDLSAQHDLNVMRALTVGEAMTPDFPTVRPSLSLEELGEIFHRTDYHGFPVVDENDRLIGIVTLGDYTRAAQAGQVAGTVADIFTRNPITAFPDETLEDAVRRFGTNGIGRVPVVERRDPQKLLGLLRAADVSRAYSRALAAHTELRERMARVRAGTDRAMTFVELEITPESRAKGKPICELRLPGDSVLVSIKRQGRTLIPHGNTSLQAGDRVLAFVSKESEENLEQALTEKKVHEEA